LFSVCNCVVRSVLSERSTCWHIQRRLSDQILTSKEEDDVLFSSICTEPSSSDRHCNGRFFLFLPLLQGLLLQSILTPVKS
jgi:hypothetical protein